MLGRAVDGARGCRWPLIALLLALLFGTSSASAADGEIVWSRPAPLPTPRDRPGVAVSDDLTYAFGGWNPSRLELAAVEQHDPTGERWLPRASKLEARYSLAIAAAGGTLQAAGHQDGQGVAEVGTGKLAPDDPTGDETNLPSATGSLSGTSGRLLAAIVLLLVAGALAMVGVLRRRTSGPAVETGDRQTPPGRPFTADAVRAPLPAADLPGREVAIPSGYEILGEPKRGGMAVVYRARQRALDRQVALKVISPALLADPPAVLQFYEEARRTARLDHPNIVSVYDLGQIADGSPFIAMRYIDGATLRELLALSGPLPVDRVVGIGAQVAEALAYAHGRGIIHRDVKPSNIMIDDGDRATLTDFGIARMVGGVDVAQAGLIVGTPCYISPEQAAGRVADNRADLYSLGVVLFEMLAGRTPFEAETPEAFLRAHVSKKPPSVSDVAPGVPAGLAAIVGRLLEKDPGARYQTGQELVEVLRGFLVPAADKKSGRNVL